MSETFDDSNSNKAFFPHSEYFFAVRAVRSVFPYLFQDKSIWRKRCLETQKTPIDICRKAVGWPMNQRQ
jgi:hypothetical protein